MPASNCAVVNCKNNSKKLKKWKESICDIHGLKKGLCPCSLTPPFRLFMFPSENRYKEKREKWIRLLRRETVKKTAWRPVISDRVCNEHFIDNEPTVSNPDPTLKLGYEIPLKIPRRILFRGDPIEPSATASKKRKASIDGIDSVALPAPSIQISSDHSYCLPPSPIIQRCDECV